MEPSEPLPADIAMRLQTTATATANSTANSTADNEASPEQPAEQYQTGVRFILLTAGLILSIFLAALDSSILATAIPRITDEFHTVKDVGWYSAAYWVSNASLLSTWGRAYKFFPIVRTFVVAVVIFELGNVICAVAPNSPTLIVGRIVSGLGGGGIMTGCFIVIALSAKPQYRAAYLGVFGVTFGAASVLGPLLGGFLTDGPGWRWCFWISLPIAAFGVSMLALFFKTPAAAQPVRCSMKEKLLSLDLLGACLILGSLSCFVLATESGGVEYQWQNWRVVTSLCATAVLFVLFVVNEWLMGSRAMIQAHLLKKRNITLNLMFQFFLAGLFFPLTYALPIQFQSVSNASATQSGLRLIPLILGVSVFTMTANAILTFWRRFSPLLVVGAVTGTIGAGLIRTLGADAHIASWIGYEILIGFGVGLALQVPMIANQAAVGVEDMAAVTSMTLFVENVSTSIFIAATEAAFTNGLVKSLSYNAPSVKPELVINTGATRIRTTFGADEVHGILRSYLDGCHDSQFIPIACGASAVLTSMLIAVPAAAKTWESSVRKRA